MTTATGNDRRVIDAYAIALDETDYYNLHPADAPFIKRILGVYLFDRNERVHCCELPPSYFLIYLYTCVEFVDGIDDDMREAIDEKFANEPSDDCYIHCSSIERIIAADTRSEIDHYGDVAANDLEDGIADPDERHSAEMDRIQEDLRGNCPF